MFARNLFVTKKSSQMYGSRRQSTRIASPGPEGEGRGRMRGRRKGEGEGRRGRVRVKRGEEEGWGEEEG